MKEFRTLLWREYRSSWGWVAGLLGSLAVWAWIMTLPGMGGSENAVAVHSSIISAAFFIGAVVLSFMVGRLYGEIRRGEDRVLLLSPVPGYVHILSRLVFAVGVGWIYSIGLGVLEWWTFVQAGARLGVASVLQLVLVSPTFGVVTLLLPTLAWVLLFVLFTSAYRLSRLGWLAVITMGAGTPVSLIYTGIIKLDRFFPVWHVAPGIIRFLDHIASNPYPARGSSLTMAIPGIVHSGDIVGTLMFTGLILFLAGRLWEEVEG